MPLYEYECPGCKTVVEVLMSNYNKTKFTPPNCKTCDKKTKKVPSVSGDMSNNWKQWSGS